MYIVYTGLCKARLVTSKKYVYRNSHFVLDMSRNIQLHCHHSKHLCFVLNAALRLVHLSLAES